MINIQKTFAVIYDITSHETASLKIGGLSLLERQVFTFYYAGITNITIFTINNNNFSVLRQLEDLNLKIVTPLDELKIDQDCFVSDSSVIYNKKLLELIKQKGISSKINLVSGNQDDGSKRKIKSSGDQINQNALFTGLIFIPKSKTKSFGEFASSGKPLVEFLENNTNNINIIENENFFFKKIKDLQSAKEAEILLFHSLRKPQDGIIARSVNRNFSLPVSRILANFSFTPNQLSVLNALFAVFAFLFLTLGHSILGLSLYLSGVLGGIFMQLCSIYDGCDGEIARVKFQYTHFGDWLDTIIDDTTNSLYFIGIFVWSYFYTSEPVYIYMGISAFIGQWTANFVMYYYLLKIAGTGNNQDYKVGKEGSFLSNIVNKLKYLTKRDFHLFAFMGFGLFGLYHIAAYFIFIMATLTGFVLLVQHIKLILSLKKISLKQ